LEYLLKKNINKTYTDTFIILSESWGAGMGVVISDKSFRAVIALFLLLIKFSSGWACHTIFSVP
jgi:hypothetical protein